MNKNCVKTLIQSKLKPGVLILISGFSGSYNIEFRSGMWGDHTNKKFVYMILAKAKDHDDDYIVLNTKGKIERLTCVTHADLLEIL